MPSPERTQMAADNLELRVIEVLDRLWFYDDLICHDEVGPVETELLLSVEDRYQLFWPKRDVMEAQLNAKSHAVDRLNKARAAEWNPATSSAP